jgi:hypothetical protein
MADLSDLDVLMTLISANVLQRAQDHAQRFRTAEPFRHVVIEDFLDVALCKELREDFPAFEDRHALNEMGQVGGKAVRMDVRDISDAYRALDRYLQTPEFLDYVSTVTGIPDLLYDPDYIGGGTHENRQGQGLDAHVDFNYHPRTRWHRRLNLIVYFNEGWQSSWGGELELHSDPWNSAANRTVSVPPLFNTAVIFETNEVSWHGFSQIDLPEDRRGLSRKSFAIYLYTVERPPQETAPPHATIYVPETMPADWAVGRSLSDGDVRELSTRFSRLRTQLRYLYDREKRFGAQIASLEQALAEARGAQRLELQGYATQPHGVQGLWPDGWVGAEFAATFVPTRAAKNVTLELWAPPQLGADQELRVEISGEVYTQILHGGMRTSMQLPLRTKVGGEAALKIRASRTWIPADDAGGGDQRALAYKILVATIDS